ncbi:S-adenosyl-L-methionine-dependent methyltransferase [Hygrophoropsis aurantiaca]|uniref:S-adenosyl-L-methionine-dependent methyltransferase n=1 Tax=Hygrophoropsis aurantiaca TaxID=72124 RepID=A0ACB8A8P8_9AGAM|nr:S-adenosyl-L-methionine-dependent methyltransferase [Hygrophoropsis aurantiaca]
MSGEAQLEALLEIINSSARQAIAEYKNRGTSVPTLDAPEFHSLDLEEDTVALKKAIRLLEGACQQLCVTLAPPQHTVINFAQSYDWACIDVAIRAGIADILNEHPEGMHISELAELAHLEKGKLSRVLRVLASKGCFTLVDTDVFANNRLSLILRSSSNAGCLVRIHAQDVSQVAGVLYETLVDPEYATSYEPDKAPLIYVLKQKGLASFFDWIKEDDERREHYHRAMIGLGEIMGSLSVLHHYPWENVSTVCDVGASIGTFSLPLAKKFPHIKITDQDLSEVLVQAKDVWAKDAPEVLQEQRVEFIPLNFFEESPVEGKDVYYLRNIIHDWPDAKAAVILRNVRKAMGPHSRLLIHDYVLANGNRKSVSTSESMGADIAPEPMLPNFGAGNSRMYQQDLNMWFIHNAKERTLADSISLGAGAGLRLEKVYDLAESAVLEFRLA